jgi:hypothetical protein
LLFFCNVTLVGSQGDFYDKEIRVVVLGRIRSEENFDSLEVRGNNLSRSHCSRDTRDHACRLTGSAALTTSLRADFYVPHSFSPPYLRKSKLYHTIEPGLLANAPRTMLSQQDSEQDSLALGSKK